MRPGRYAAVLQLLTSEDQTLLVWWDALLVLDLGLHNVNGIASLDLECDGLDGQCLHEDLHVCQCCCLIVATPGRFIATSNGLQQLQLPLLATESRAAQILRIEDFVENQTLTRRG